ncbi:MAG: hypothetical protein ACTSX9_05780 [Candidatus Njordarchaeales archaeon]
MTGPAEGKVRIPVDFIVDGEKLECTVYIHLKGYSRARVTHIDIEDFECRGDKINGGVAIGTKDGFSVIMVKEIEINGKKVKKFMLRGINILGIGERARCVVGIKEGGIFIGFESKVLTRLEEIARKELSNSEKS